MTFRKKLYQQLEDLQTDLNTWIKTYNEERTHQGKICCGRTPMTTFLDAKTLAEQKQIAQDLNLQNNRSYPGCLSDQVGVSAAYLIQNTDLYFLISLFMSKILIFFSLFFFFLCTSFAHAKRVINRIGLISYPIVSAENLDYLQKAVEESLAASLREQEFSVIPVEAVTESLEKSPALFLKSQKIAAVLTGSIVKVGKNIEVHSRLYHSSSLQPIALTQRVDHLDQLLPALREHAVSLGAQWRNSISSLPKTETAPPAPVIPVLPSSTPAEKTKSEIHKKEKTKPVLEVRSSGTFSFPDYLKMSEKLGFPARGMAYDDLNRDGKPELILIDLQKVEVYAISQDLKLQLLKSYNGDRLDHFVKVDTFDLDQDGNPEILVSNLKNGQAESFALKDNGSNLTILFKEAPWLLEVLEQDSGKILIGEPYFGRAIENHNLRRLEFRGNGLVEKEELGFPKNVGIYGLKPVLGSQNNRFIYLANSGELRLYEKNGNTYRKIWTSSERYGGSANFIEAEVRSVFNQVEDEKTYFNLEPLITSKTGEPLTVWVAKNETFLKGVVGKRPLQKNAWFVKLESTELGLRELLQTRKIDGYIADQFRVRLPGAKREQILALIWLREPGFGGVIDTPQAVLAVYDL